jgi:hypothetical protein
MEKIYTLSPEEAQRQSNQDKRRVLDLALNFASDRFYFAEYLGVSSEALSDPKKVRSAINKKRQEIAVLPQAQQGEANQFLTDVKDVLLTEGAFATYQAGRSPGHPQSRPFAKTGDVTEALVALFNRLTPKQQDFLNRASEASSKNPREVNSLIQEWEGSLSSSSQYYYCDDKLVSSKNVGWMMCHLTEKLCSGFITNDWCSDESSLFYEAVHARMTFFRQLLQRKVDPIDYGGRNGMAQTQFRKYADDMVSGVIQAHEQTLKFPEDHDGKEGLVHGFIKNPTPKEARFQLFDDIKQLCGWANAESAGLKVQEFMKKPENRCTREEIWAVQHLLSFSNF